MFYEYVIELYTRYIRVSFFVGFTFTLLTKRHSLWFCMNKFIEISGTLGLEDTQLKVQFYLNSSRLDSTNTNREVYE